MRFYPNRQLLWCFLLIFSNCLNAHASYFGYTRFGKKENTLTCNHDHNHNHDFRRSCFGRRHTTTRNPKKIRKRFFRPTTVNNCNNVGFELGTFEGWEGSYGAEGVISEQGLVEGRHTIMTGGGMDPITNQIPVVAPGSNYSVRLGNSNDGFEADQLVTKFLVTEDNSLFSYKFAVVMEDPGHPQEEQPRFEIAAYDEDGTLIPCTYYLVISAPFIEGFESLGSIRYRDWSTVGIDLSGYIGQNISITFTTIDCAQGGHFGYAYIDAECLVAELSIDCNDPEVCGENSAYCPGASSIILTAPEGFVNYVWNTGATERVITVDDPEPGSEYSVTFNNVNSIGEDTCTIELSIEIPDPPPIEILMEDSVKICDGSTVTLEPGGDFIGYSWSTGVATPSIEVDQSGTYEVTVTTADGCSGSETVDVVLGSPPAFNIDAFPTSCSYSTDGSANVEIAGPDENYSILWNNGASGANIDNLSPGQYCATISDPNGCEAENCIEITTPAAIVPNIQSVDNLCFGDRNGQIGLNPAGGMGPYLYALDETTFSTTSDFAGLPAGSYTIAVQDVNGCIVEEQVVISEPIELLVDLGPDLEVQLGDSITLDAVTTYPVDSFQWQNLLGFDCTNCPNPNLRPLNTANYPVQVVDENGCVAEDELTIYVRKDRRVYIPNAFSPNGDGTNDIFYIFGGNDVTRVKSLQLFSRWGELMMTLTDFDPNDPQYGWDGSFRGSPAGQAVYVYHAEVEFLDGETLFFKGDVNLIR